MMKLGIIGGYDEKSFRQAKEYGLSFLELCMNIRTDIAALEADTDNILRRIEETGVTIGSIGRWGGQRILADGSVNPEELDIAKRLIDVCQKLDCPVYVTGCRLEETLTYEQNCEAAIRFFGELCEYGELKGVKIAAYNCRWDNFVCNDRAWTKILGALPALGIKFDPSHAIYAGEDYLSLMKKWGKRFYHIHLKGSLVIDGQRFDDPPIGMDSTNWGAFMAVLYQQKYEGGLSLEPHSETWFGEMRDKGIRFSLQYIRPFLLS